MSEDIPNHLPNWISKHVELYLTDPEKAHMWDSAMAGGKGLLPTLLLITRGRKSGREIMLPLIYKKIGDDYVIIASKGGAPAHPSWYLNLNHQPDCEIKVGSEHFTVTAGDVEGSMRDDYWQQMAEIYPPYEDYKKYAGDRVIPVVALKPR